LSGADARAKSVDVLVLGGGVVGAAAAAAAAHESREVVLLERFELGAARGSSKGTARIFCPAAYPDDGYAELGLRALDGWRRLEAAAGETLLHETGIVSVGEFAARQLPALRDAGEPAEEIDAGQALSRLGIALDDARPIIHQPRAGVIAADRARAALLAAGQRAGVALRERERAIAIDDRGDRVAVTTDGGSWDAEAVIVATGPWNRDLLAGAGIGLEVSVSRQSVAYLRLADPATVAPAGLIDFDGDEPYALWDPARGLKAAFHARGPAADPNDDGLSESSEEVARIGEWAASRYPEIAGEVIAAEPCLYTNTADERFIVERHGRVIVASACSGHGFQFAPETGRRAAELAAEVAGAPVA
jgi:sarcosine oxidase